MQSMRSIVLAVCMLIAGVCSVGSAYEYANVCPFTDEGSGLSIGGYTVDASVSIASSSQGGIVLSNQQLYQQAGEQRAQVVEEDSLIEGQGYSTSLNGQGAWNYVGNWTITGNDVITSRELGVNYGRMNPAEELYMISLACPPEGESPYLDNLTHVIGEENAYTSNYADLFAGGYASRGLIAPGQVESDMAFVGTGGVIWNAGFTTNTGIARNTTVPVTTYVLEGRIMVPVTTMENRTAVVMTGHTTYHGSYIQYGPQEQVGISFRYHGVRSEPY